MTKAIVINKLLGRREEMAWVTRAAFHPKNYTYLLFWDQQDSVASDRYEGKKNNGKGGE